MIRQCIQVNLGSSLLDLIRLPVVWSLPPICVPLPTLISIFNKPDF